MNDQFLRDLRREPSPAFARRLRASLDDGAESHGSQSWLRRWAPLAASLAVVGLAFSFPGVRAGAQAFLDLFRVQNVIGVTFNPRQFQVLEESGLNLPALLGHPAGLTPPAEPVTVATTAEASAAAGFGPLEPAWLPVGVELRDIEVIAEQTVAFTTSTAALEILLEALEIDDLTVPAGLDGQEVSVHVPPVIGFDYADATGSRAQLLQAPSPEVAMPAGLDLPVLAEIGLRIIGLDREEAFDLAQTIDWRSTLIVPVPATEAAIEQVNIRGQDGIAILLNDADQRMLIWSDGERAYAMEGSLPLRDLLEMAQSAQ